MAAIGIKYKSEISSIRDGETASDQVEDVESSIKPEQRNHERVLVTEQDVSLSSKYFSLEP